MNATAETFIAIEDVCTVSPRFNPRKHRAGFAPATRLIVARTADGTEYINNVGEIGSTDPRMANLTMTLRKIRDAGKINAAHWHRNTGKRLA